MHYEEVHQFNTTAPNLTENEILQILKEERIPEHLWSEIISKANRVCTCCHIQPVELLAWKLDMCESCNRDDLNMGD
jgi:hypothetical protein